MTPSRRRRVRRPGALRMRDLVTALCFIAVFAFAAAWMENRSRERIEGVARIIDGDSLVLDGRRLRLLGIDAPEFDQTCNVAGRTERCGLIAAERLRSVTSQSGTVCRLSQKDRYGRELADCESNGVHLNAWMVRSGFAVSFGGFKHEEDLARAERAGFWAGEFERPADWRKRRSKEEEPPHQQPGRIWTFFRSLLGV